jgi:uncharacterized protein
MATYHQRRPKKAITDRAELLSIIDGQSIMTLAMAMDNEPYLVTVNYGFEPHSNCFYFHCSKVGKKMDFMRANPLLWGQVVEDRGYMDGQCEHSYRSVHFCGHVTFLEGEDEKRRAVNLMIDHLESDPETVKARFSKPDALDNVMLVRLQVEEMTGKQHPTPKNKE